MAASFILSYDAGTGSSKTLLFDPVAGVVARSLQRYAPRLSSDGRAEQSPDEWWDAFVTATRDALRQAGGRGSVRGIVFTGQMLGLVPVGRDRALGDAIVWLDARARDEAAALARKLGGKVICRVLFGAAPSAKDVVPKMLWLRNHDAGRLEHTRWLLDVPGYLAWRASGVAAIDWSGASATGLLDRHARRWSYAVARYAGVPLELLPAIATPGTRIGGLQPTAAKQLGLPMGTPIVCGTGDVVAAAIGCGADQPGAAHMYLGTSGWISTVSTRPLRGVTALQGPRPDRYHAVLQSESVGACLEWIARVVCGAADGQAFQRLEALAIKAAPGAGGVEFRPFLWGERAPLDDPDARAAFAGIGAGTGRAELVRAVWEGVTRNMQLLAEQLSAQTILPDRIAVCGGAARSDLLLQMITGRSGLELERVACPEDTVALGAALIAAQGLGIAVAPARSGSSANDSLRQ